MGGVAVDGLLTEYGEKLDPSRPLSEYPRPQMVRASYLNLNGAWLYAMTAQGDPPACWDGDIVVPFSPGSLLSGVQRVLQPDEFLWYQRIFTVPKDFLQARVLLHFGAVEQNCAVFVNGHAAGSHRGGYLPFTLDITHYLAEGPQTLTVKVSDPTDDAPFARGRQKRQHGGGWHTPHRGIWQTVWLESVPQVYIHSLKITPLYDDSAVEIDVAGAGGPLAGTLQIFARGTLVTQGAFTAGRPLQLKLPGFLSWHPKMPFLYTLYITAGQDAVESYFGMRKLHVEADEGGQGRLMLNNRPFLGAGVLDRGLYSDGLYTPPSDRAMVDDLRFARACGFTMIRKHGKIEPLRWYYHCDKVGLLVWQDVPAGDGNAKMTLWGGLCARQKVRSDQDPKRLGRKDAAGREAFMQDMHGIADLLHNSPSVGAWVLFQRGQGQFSAAGAAALAKQLNPAWVVDHASGWYDQGAGEVASVHLTRHNQKKWLKPPAGKDTRAFLLTQADVFGPPPRREGVPLTREARAKAVSALYQEYLIPLKRAGLCGFFLYQLSDAGDEVSGLRSFDRRTQKLHPKGLETLNSFFTTKK